MTRTLQGIAAVLLAASIPIACDRGPARQDSMPDAGVPATLAAERTRQVSAPDYDLEFRIPSAAGDDIDASMTLRFELAGADRPVVLDFRESGDRVRTVRVNGVDTDWSFRTEHIVLPAAAFVAGTNRIDIEFTAGSTSLNRNPDYLYTLFVPDRARTAFPVFDQPDLKGRFALTLDVPGTWNAVSNGAVQAVEESHGRKRIRFDRTDPISTYLFSFAAGRFETLTQTVGGREMTMLHRETDRAKVERNVAEVFRLHAVALDWLEGYTEIDYPFAKLDFVLIPAFQYGGMEHAGAIQYRASGIFLDEAPSERQLLARASLIAHETAHMWFGNLVTMKWFDDVWMKEVFANFMAAKIVNPSFPDIDHELNFLVRHYPAAYAVDRTAGANPIRQELANLNQAGQLYGNIIYNKAPIMMRQLEAMIGEEAFRDGLREYLRTYAFGNASWPDLIAILDRDSNRDLRAWSEVWVNWPSRPVITVAAARTGSLYVRQQVDTESYGWGDDGIVWPQRFALGAPGAQPQTIVSDQKEVSVPHPGGAPLMVNIDGKGYGRFPADPALLDHWPALDDVAKASLLISSYENLLAGQAVTPAGYIERLMRIVAAEPNELVLGLALDQLDRVFWLYLPEAVRVAKAPGLEQLLWGAMLGRQDASRRKIFFDAYKAVVSTGDGVLRAYGAWNGDAPVDNLPLSENDRIDLAAALAIRLPAEAGDIAERQLADTRNPDNVRRLTYLLPSLSADPAVRDAFFASLADESMRETESWVLEALENLHHPLRTGHSERYILPSLELLEEIQMTGDIFFPKRWLDATLGNYRTATALRSVRAFIEGNPDYNLQLRSKILQSADPLFRANDLAARDRAE